MATTSAGTVSLEGCEEQVASSLTRANNETVAAVQEDVCEGVQTLSEERFTVTAADAPQIADALGMSHEQKKSFVGRAAAGAVKGATWTHSYVAVAVKEVHTGTTYWDGDKAWVAAYRGLTGKHTCHAEGGWQVGATVEKISCNKPGPSAKADSVDRFDIHMIAKGFPVVLNVGLHNAYTNKGIRSTWQVGG